MKSLALLVAVAGVGFAGYHYTTQDVADGSSCSVCPLTGKQLTAAPVKTECSSGCCQKSDEALLTKALTEGPDSEGTCCSKSEGTCCAKTEAAMASTCCSKQQGTDALLTSAPAASPEKCEGDQCDGQDCASCSKCSKTTECCKEKACTKDAETQTEDAVTAAAAEEE